MNEGLKIQSYLDGKKSLALLVKLEILDAWRIDNDNLFHISTIVLKKLLLKVVVLTKFFFSVISSL